MYFGLCRSSLSVRIRSAHSRATVRCPDEYHSIVIAWLHDWSYYHFEWRIVNSHRSRRTHHSLLVRRSSLANRSLWNLRTSNKWHNLSFYRSSNRSVVVRRTAVRLECVAFSYWWNPVDCPLHIRCLRNYWILVCAWMENKFWIRIWIKDRRKVFIYNLPIGQQDGFKTIGLIARRLKYKIVNVLFFDQIQIIWIHAVRFDEKTKISRTL